MVSASSPPADSRPAVRVVKQQGDNGSHAGVGSKGKEAGGDAHPPLVDEQLDEALDMTFPASDPIAVQSQKVTAEEAARGSVPTEDSKPAEAAPHAPASRRRDTGDDVQGEAKLKHGKA